MGESTSGVEIVWDKAMRILGRAVTGLILVGISFTATLYLFRDNLPGVWRDFRCIPSYAQQPTLPYSTFLAGVRGGKITSILLSSEQAQAYVTLPSGSYRVKLPELDATWAEILAEKHVKVIELIAGSC